MPTYSQSLNKAFENILGEDERVYLIGEDICDPYGGAFKITKGLSTKYPNRVLNTPISEAGITGLATGMAIKGLRTVLEIMFGDFLSLAADQIISNISKLSWMYNGKINIPIVIRAPMGGRRGYGPTHSQCIEKIFLGIPGIKIVAPSYCHNVGQLLKTSILDDDPILFVEHKLDYPRKLKSATNGKIDEWFVRSLGDYYPTIALSLTDFEDDAVTIITYGGMVPIVKEAMEKLLYEEDIASQILIPSLINPFEIEDLLSFIKKNGRIITAEEGTLTNGWGAEVVAQLSDRFFKYLKAPVKRVAAMNRPIASTRSLENHILPSVDSVIKTVKEVL